MRKEYPINGLEQDVIYGRSIYCSLKNNNKIYILLMHLKMIKYKC